MKANEDANVSDHHLESCVGLSSDFDSDFDDELLFRIVEDYILENADAEPDQNQNNQNPLSMLLIMRVMRDG